MKTLGTLFLIITLTFCRNEVFAQNYVEEKDTTIYEAFNIDRNPILIDNEKQYEISELREFIKEHIEFPNTEEDCVGKVFISIIIEKDGTVKKKEFVKKLCSGFDENAMKVIDLMKKWKPGIKSGRPVRTKLIIPLSFVIN